jgi:hypothetical protein
MKRLVFITLGLVSSLSAQAPKGRQVAVVDLTTPDAVRSSGPIETEGGLRSGLTPRPTGLEVRFVGSSRRDFKLGDRFAYELEVSNTGTQSIDVPSSADLRNFVPGPGVGLTTISLQMRRQNSSLASFGATLLAGAESVPGSLQRLEPGDTMLIRLPASMALYDEDPTEFSSRGAVPVTVVVTIDSGNEQVRWAPVISKNSIPFLIRR